MKEDDNLDNLPCDNTTLVYRDLASCSLGFCNLVVRWVWGRICLVLARSWATLLYRCKKGVAARLCVRFQQPFSLNPIDPNPKPRGWCFCLALGSLQLSVSNSHLGAIEKVEFGVQYPCDGRLPSEFGFTIFSLGSSPMGQRKKELSKANVPLKGLWGPIPIRGDNQLSVFTASQDLRVASKVQ